MELYAAKAFAQVVKDFILPQGRLVAEHDYNEVFLQCKSDISRLLDCDLSSSRILVLGCGYNYPDVILWSSMSSMVVGLDVQSVYWRNALARLFHSKGKGLAESLAKAFLQRRAYAGYYQRLRELASQDLDETCQDLVNYDGTRFPFADDSFDVVISNAVLEHVADVKSVLEEALRVTRPSGIGYHLWHNYLSLSGGHVPESEAISHPWGHLLDNVEVKSAYPSIIPSLNRLQPNEMLDLLSSVYEQKGSYGVDKRHNKRGIDSQFQYEGERLLTAQLEQRLSDYSKELLLTRSFLFIGKKGKGV